MKNRPYLSTSKARIPAGYACVITALLFLLMLTVPSAAMIYTLDDLYRSVLERNETIKIAEEDLSLSETDKAKARAVLLPTLSAFGTHRQYSEKKTQLGFLLQPDYTQDWGLRLDQTISLSGREYTAYRSALDGIQKSRHDLDAVKEDLLEQVSNEYYTLLRAHKGVDIARADVERLTKYREAAKVRLEVGEITKTILLRAEAELAGSESDLISAENILRIARTRLAETARLKGEFDIAEPDKPLDIKALEETFVHDIPFNKECALVMLDCLKNEAMIRRAEIRSLEMDRKIAEDNVTYAKGTYWPDLSVEGVYSRQENEPSSSFGIDERLYGGLRLDFPFFEGGLKKAEVSEARAKLRQAEYRISDRESSISTEVENSYYTVKTAVSVLTKRHAEVEYAEHNFNAVTKQFQHGLADGIDVIDANTLLVTSERERANAEFTYRLALLRLQRSTGTLLEKVTTRLFESSADPEDVP